MIDQGDVITFEVTMDKAVTVTSASGNLLQLPFQMGGGTVTGGLQTPLLQTKLATFDSVNSTSTLLKFNYTVQTNGFNDDLDTNGISISAGSLQGGSIFNNGTSTEAGRNWTGNIADDANYRIDALDFSSGGGGLLIRGVNISNKWFYYWDTNSNGLAFDTRGRTDTFQDGSDNKGWSVASTAATNQTNANLTFDAKIASGTDLQSIRTATLTPASTTDHPYWGDNWHADGITSTYWTDSSNRGYVLNQDRFSTIGDSRSTIFEVTPTAIPVI